MSGDALHERGRTRPRSERLYRPSIGAPPARVGWTAVLLAAVLLALPRGAGAQTVLVHVLESETSQPLTGAVAHLVSPDGAVLASRLSDRTGRVLFTNVEAGRYRVRAEMLGRATEESEAFEVATGVPVPLQLRLPARAIELAGVEVTADAGPCETRPTQEGRLLADVWEEARKALSATAVTDRQGLYRYSLVLYEQDLDEDGAVVDEQQTRQQGGYIRSPFASQAVEELTQEGFVRRAANEWTYFAPDAEALLSDPFLDTHCFRLVDGGTERPQLVGLAFEPNGRNEDVPDISGTLWLDRDSVALRWLDFTYENLEPEVRPGDATGRVAFERMPEGAWIVPEWSIRAPVVQVDVSRNDRRRRIQGFRRTGGRVQEVVAAGGGELVRGATTGAIEGIVVDSLGLPIAGARVGFVGSNQTLFTNAEGRFNLVGLMEGTYRIRFVDPDLEFLGFEPPEVTREVTSGVSSYLEFLMPRPADLLRDFCADRAEPGSGVLGGVVRDAGTGEPVVGAEVRARWTRLELNGAGAGLIGREVYTELSTTTDGSGVYVFCSVPRREEIRVVSSVGDVDGSSELVTIASEQEALMHGIRYDPRRAGGREPAGVGDSGAVESDRSFTKLGRVRAAGSGDMLAEALVELPEIGIKATSDDDGRVVIEDLPAGQYALRVERRGYVPIEATLDVPGGQEFAVLLERAQSPYEGDPGGVVGRVVDERNQPVRDVDVQVVGQPGRRAITNQQGRFRIEELEPGLLEIQFDRLGHTSRTARFVVQDGRTAELSVTLPTQAIELEPISVTVRPRFLEDRGFYRRRDQGFGAHFDSQDLDRINPIYLSDVVRRVPGLIVNDPQTSDPSGRGGTVGAPSYAINPRIVSLIGDRVCRLELFIDGIRMTDQDLTQIDPSVIEAVEVYEGGSAPIQYQQMTSCGAILVWTKR